MLNHPNISIAFISENTYTNKYPLGSFIERKLTKDYKILRYFTTEFLEIPVNALKKNIDTFSLTDWIKELPESDILILEDAQELKGLSSSQIFLGNILIELISMCPTNEELLNEPMSIEVPVSSSYSSVIAGIKNKDKAVER